MERRAFLKGAAVLPIAGIEGFALAQAEAEASAGGIHVIGEGQDRFNEKHSLGYSTILFKTTPSETNGAALVVEHIGMKGGGPPVHFHLHQDEWFYVMEGQVVFQVAGQRKTLTAGESVLGPRGIPHGFCPIGEKPVRMLIAFTPAGKMEGFFRETAVPNGPKMTPAMFAKYDMKYVGPPLVV
jgi:quercetin dioxygenase-like cupin family protein